MSQPPSRYSSPSLDQLVHDHFAEPTTTSPVRPDSQSLAVILSPDMRHGPEASPFAEVIESPWGAALTDLVFAPGRADLQRRSDTITWALHRSERFGASYAHMQSRAALLQQEIERVQHDVESEVLNQVQRDEEAASPSTPPPRSKGKGKQRAGTPFDVPQTSTPTFSPLHASAQDVAVVEQRLRRTDTQSAVSSPSTSRVPIATVAENEFLNPAPGEPYSGTGHDRFRRHKSKPLPTDPAKLAKHLAEVMERKKQVVRYNARIEQPQAPDPAPLPLVNFQSTVAVGSHVSPPEAMTHHSAPPPAVAPVRPPILRQRSEESILSSNASTEVDDSETRDLNLNLPDRPVNPPPISQPARTLLPGYGFTMVEDDPDRPADHHLLFGPPRPPSPPRIHGERFPLRPVYHAFPNRRSSQGAGSSTAVQLASPPPSPRVPYTLPPLGPIDPSTVYEEQPFAPHGPHQPGGFYGSRADVDQHYMENNRPRHPRYRGMGSDAFYVLNPMPQTAIASPSPSPSVSPSPSPPPQLPPPEPLTPAFQPRSPPPEAKGSDEEGVVKAEEEELDLQMPEEQAQVQPVPAPVLSFLAARASTSTAPQGFRDAQPAVRDTGMDVDVDEVEEDPSRLTSRLLRRPVTILELAAARDRRRQYTTPPPHITTFASWQIFEERQEAERTARLANIAPSGMHSSSPPGPLTNEASGSGASGETEPELPLREKKRKAEREEEEEPSADQGASSSASSSTTKPPKKRARRSVAASDRVLRSAEKSRVPPKVEEVSPKPARRPSPKGGRKGKGKGKGKEKE